MFEDFRKFLLVSDFRFHDADKISLSKFLSVIFDPISAVKNRKFLPACLPGDFCLPLNDKEFATMRKS